MYSQAAAAAVAHQPDVIIRGFDIPGSKPKPANHTPASNAGGWNKLFGQSQHGKLHKPASSTAVRPQDTQAVEAFPSLPGQTKRRGSVVLQNRSAVMLNEAPSGTTTPALSIPTPIPSRAPSPGPPGLTKKQRNKKNKAAKKQVAALIDEGIAISSSSSTSPKSDEAIPTGAHPIAFPKRLSASRTHSNISSLSSSFQDLRHGFPQLSINTSNPSHMNLDSANCRLQLASGDRVTVDIDGQKSESYEVQLEEDFMSPDVRKKSPLHEMFESDADGKVVGGVGGSPPAAADDGREKGKMYADDFETLKMLGKGSYGTVLLVRHKATGRLYAQKQLKKASLIVHKKLVDQTKAERTILSSLSHPYIVKLFYAFQDHKKLYLILEYASGGELFSHLSLQNMFPESTTAFYIAQLVLALQHLHHTVGVVYRDLKPENCLLDQEGHLLMTDFGLSKVAEEGARCKSVLGTPEYMAPEILRGEDYSFEVDWWSLGALAYDLLTGSPPYPGNNHTAILQKIQKKKLQMPFYLSAEARDLLSRLLRKEPGKRLGSNMPKDLETIKGHRFFRKIDWKALERRECVAPIKPLVTDPELAENFDREFTECGMSPVITRNVFWETVSRQGAFPTGDGKKAADNNGVGEMGSYGEYMVTREAGEDPFGGFSFQAGSVMEGYFRDF